MNNLNVMLAGYTKAMNLNAHKAFHTNVVVVHNVSVETQASCLVEWQRNTQMFTESFPARALGCLKKNMYN